MFWAKFQRFIEQYHTILLAIIGAYLLIVVYKDNTTINKVVVKMSLDSFLTLLITIESTLFGFLLAFLAIMLQLNSKFIELVKKLNRDKGLILFNKSAVISSIVIVLFASLILVIKDFDVYKNCEQYIIKMLMSAIIYNVLSVKRFISIFYKIARF